MAQACYFSVTAEGLPRCLLGAACPLPLLLQGPQRPCGAGWAVSPGQGDRGSKAPVVLEEPQPSHTGPLDLGSLRPPALSVLPAPGGWPDPRTHSVFISLASPCFWHNSLGLIEACAPLTGDCRIQMATPWPPKHEAPTGRDLRPFLPGPSFLHSHINVTSSASLHRVSAGISLTIYPKLSSLSPPPR